MSFITPKQVTVTTSSTIIFTPGTFSPGSVNGKQFFEMTNDGDDTIYLAFGQDAELGKGTPLNSGDRYYLDASNNIDRYFIRFGCNAIASGDTSLAIQEFDYDNT